MSSEEVDGILAASDDEESESVPDADPTRADELNADLAPSDDESAPVPGPDPAIEGQEPAAKRARLVPSPPPSDQPPSPPLLLSSQSPTPLESPPPSPHAEEEPDAAFAEPQELGLPEPPTEAPVPEPICDEGPVRSCNALLSEPTTPSQAKMYKQRASEARYEARRASSAAFRTYEEWKSNPDHPDQVSYRQADYQEKAEEWEWHKCLAWERELELRECLDAARYEQLNNARKVRWDDALSYHAKRASALPYGESLARDAFLEFRHVQYREHQQRFDIQAGHEFVMPKEANSSGERDPSGDQGASSTAAQPRGTLPLMWHTLKPPVPPVVAAERAEAKAARELAAAEEAERAAQELTQKKKQALEDAKLANEEAQAQAARAAAEKAEREKKEEEERAAAAARAEAAAAEARAEAAEARRVAAAKQRLEKRQAAVYRVSKETREACDKRVRYELREEEAWVAYLQGMNGNALVKQQERLSANMEPDCYVIADVVEKVPEADGGEPTKVSEVHEVKCIDGMNAAQHALGQSIWQAALSGCEHGNIVFNTRDHAAGFRNFRVFCNQVLSLPRYGQLMGTVVLTKAHVNPNSADGTFGPNDPPPTFAEAKATIVAIWKGGQVEWVGGEPVSEEEAFTDLGPLAPQAA